MKTAWITVAILALAGCWLYQQSTTSPAAAATAGGPTTMPSDPPAPYHYATFSAGCFWGVQAAFDKVPGVISTTVGYSGGKVVNPTYEQVCTHTTGHAESVLITYDPKQISYAKLLDIFWSCHDPTTPNRQGPDIGSNYRSVIFYHDAEQEQIAKASMKEVDASHVFKAPISTEIIPAAPFYKAEEYHQHFYDKMGEPNVCHVGPAKVHTKLAEEAEAARVAAASKQPTTQPTVNAADAPN
jgi:peptide-methionine (S)-S-oxide reductase